MAPIAFQFTNRHIGRIEEIVATSSGDTTRIVRRLHRAIPRAPNSAIARVAGISRQRVQQILDPETEAIRTERYRARKVALRREARAKK